MRMFMSDRSDLLSRPLKFDRDQSIVVCLQIRSTLRVAAPSIVFLSRPVLSSTFVHEQLSSRQLLAIFSKRVTVYRSEISCEYQDIGPLRFSIIIPTKNSRSSLARYTEIIVMNLWRWLRLLKHLLFFRTKHCHRLLQDHPCPQSHRHRL